MPSSLTILYENHDLLAINKPAGLACQPLQSWDEDSVVSRIRSINFDWFPKNPGPGNQKYEAYLLHRLDVDTSGVLLLAKNESTFNQLRSLWREGSVGKFYLAEVLGTIEDGTYSVDMLMAPHPKSSKRTLAWPTHEPMNLGSLKKIHTWTPTRMTFATVGYSLTPDHEPTTYLAIKLITGYRHQIRSCLAELGYPILNDSIYKKSTRNWNLNKNNENQSYLYFQSFPFFSKIKTSPSSINKTTAFSHHLHAAGLILPDPYPTIWSPQPSWFFLSPTVFCMMT